MDSHWVTSVLVPSVIVAALLLLLLWPTEHSGRRVLRTWGIAEPTAPQIREAVRYLRQRRVLYVALFLLLPPVAGLVWPTGDDDGTPGDILLPLLAAMLIAELVATLRPVSGIRVATLDPRGWRDLVPPWAIAVTAVLAGWAAVLAVLGLSAQPWADRYLAALPPDGVPQPPTDWTIDLDPDVRAALAEPSGWFTLGGVACCLAVVSALVYLAVRRPSVSDAEVDVALRTRTARVAVAIGFPWLTGLVHDGQQRIAMLAGHGGDGLPLPRAPGWLTHDFGHLVEIVDLVVLAGALVCWMWLAVPSRRSLERVPR
ncbi:hypothetical protein [Actinophytocola sp.]|uniref:hypothetical protein n=1 Tax=Actinophytocola sp. TaxID=1872138 RepID=UPI003D6C550D